MKQKLTARDVLAAAQEERETILAHRRTIHRCPEVGQDLPRTAAYIAGELKKLGYQPQALGGGLVAAITGKDTGRCVLLRADMDALAGREQSGLDFQSDNGAMHACGHDMHAAMLLGAAALLRKYQAQLNGTVKLVFQPDEEGFTASGALRMGVNEMTRFGFGKEQFAQLAHLIADCVMRNADVREEAARLREGFTDMRYCFSDAETEKLISALAEATGI